MRKAIRIAITALMLAGIIALISGCNSSAPQTEGERGALPIAEVQTGQGQSASQSINQEASADNVADEVGSYIIGDDEVEIGEMI